jgi:hypothetical protein
LTTRKDSCGSGAQLTDNALIFNKDKMKAWWQQGYDYAQNKSELMSDNVQ